MVEQTGVGRHIGPWSPADGILVDAHDPTDSREISGDGSAQLFGVVNEQQVIALG